MTNSYAQSIQNLQEVTPQWEVLRNKDNAEALVRGIVDDDTLTILSYTVPDALIMRYGFAQCLDCLAKDITGKLYNVRVFMQKSSDAIDHLNDLIRYYDAERSKDHELVIATILLEEDYFPPGYCCVRTKRPKKHIMEVSLDGYHMDPENYHEMTVVETKAVNRETWYTVYI